MLLLKQTLKLLSLLLSGTTIGTAKYFFMGVPEASDTVSWKQKWQRQVEWEEECSKVSWLIVMAVVVEMGYKLDELLDAIVMTVQVPVVMVQGCGTAFTKHEVLPEKELWAVRCLLVQIFRNEPEQVLKRGVTEKEMLLVVVVIAVKALGSPRLPVRRDTKSSGMAETVAEMVPQMMGQALSTWAWVSMLTQMLKMGLVAIQALKVKVMMVPEGIKQGNPFTWIV